MADTTRKGQGGTPKRRLRTADDCRRFLADTINRLNRGELDPAIAGKLGYLVNVMAGILRVDGLEQRLAALEQQMEVSK